MLKPLLARFERLGPCRRGFGPGAGAGTTAVASAVVALLVGIVVVVGGGRERDSRTSAYQGTPPRRFRLDSCMLLRVQPQVQKLRTECIASSSL